MIAACCTDVAGSSNWFERGFVTYSNASKVELLGVPDELIKTHGAVSEEVASAMALGALRNSRAHVSVAVTGIAGPDGGSALKPVGTVWFAWAASEVQKSAMLVFAGNRAEVRSATVEYALQGLLDLLHS